MPKTTKPELIEAIPSVCVDHDKENYHNTNNVSAKFDNGLLTIKAPFKHPIRVGVKVPVK